MRFSTRLLSVFALSIALVLALPLVAQAAWAESPVLEKYSVSSGTRSWATSLPAAFGNGLSTDTSGSVFMCTDKGFDVYDAAGTFVRSVSIRDGGWGWDLCVAPNKQVYVVDQLFGRILRYSKTGTYKGKFGGFGNTKGKFDWPTSIACDAKGNIYVADETGRIQKFTSTGKYVRTIGGRGTKSGKFKLAPKAMAVDPAGVLYTVEGAFIPGDPSPDRVQKFNTSTGKYLSKWAVGGNDIAIDRSYNVFIAPEDAKTSAPCVRRFSKSGRLLKTYKGAWSNIEVGLGGSPWSITVDRSGGFIALCYGAG